MLLLRKLKIIDFVSFAQTHTAHKQRCQVLSSVFCVLLQIYS